MKNIDKMLITGILLIDLRKAFGRVDNDIMLAKVKRFGINCIKYKWFSSYLIVRSKPVSLDGHPSHPLPVSSLSTQFRRAWFEIME